MNTLGSITEQMNYLTVQQCIDLGYEFDICSPTYRLYYSIEYGQFFLQNLAGENVFPSLDEPENMKPNTSLFGFVDALVLQYGSMRFTDEFLVKVYRLIQVFDLYFVKVGIATKESNSNERSN